jgi:carboxyl-terminal processing protease
VRNRVGLTGVLFLFITLSLPAIIFSQQGRTTNRAGTPERAAGGKSSPGAKSPVTAAVVKNDVNEALSIIQENYIDGKKLDYNAVFKSSINGMLGALDPHSSYLDPTDLAAFKTEQQSKYFGIGATIGDLRQDGDVNTYIRATFQEAPAAQAGLRFGDRILEVDGQSMRGKTYPEVRKFLIGPRGTRVKVTVQHAATSKVETVEITRDAVPLPSIPHAYLIKPGVGYVAMTGGFNVTTADEFQAALTDLHSKGMNQLVLDLRGNRGGLLIQAVRVADQFLQRGQLIVTQKGRIRGSSDTFAALNENPDTTPLVVLVNDQTASAAEIVAGALQDHDRALIVGETTFGKGLVQYPYPLDDAALLLTVAKYFTPSGRLIQRDYSNGDFYNYYTHGGSAKDDKTQTPPLGPESLTDTGRKVYGGAGISPDEVVKPNTGNRTQARLQDPIFAFSLELTAGHIPGFDKYVIQRPITYGHDVQATDFPVTDPLFRALKNFLATKPTFKVTGEQLDQERAFVERVLRFDLATAAFGYTAAQQVLFADDPQITRAIEVMPRARELALAAQRAHPRS